MSYLRMGQEGSYVEISGGSNYYIYGNGKDISGWSYGEFAALIGQVADEIDLEYERAQEIKAAFRAHFEGWDPEYSGGITPPERAEIFCQCVDSRINGLELTDGLHQTVQDWADEFEAMRECSHCGEELRPALYNDETNYVCRKDKCDKEQQAEQYDVDIAVIEREDRIFNHLHYDCKWSFEDASDEAMDYLFEQTSEELEDE